MAKKGLRAWVAEKWVDIGAPDGKGGYKPCGRKKGEKRKGYPKCVNSDVNKSDYCPLEAKLGHTLIMVDFTSRWERPQIDWVKGRIFGDALISITPPYHRISYLKIDNTPPHSQKYDYSKCRFKTGTKTRFEGDKVNTKCEGSDFINTIYKICLSY